MTTIDEAVSGLRNMRPNVITRDQFGNDVQHLGVVERDHVTTLLAEYDRLLASSAEDRKKVEEAVRLMKDARWAYPGIGTDALAAFVEREEKR